MNQFKQEYVLSYRLLKNNTPIVYIINQKPPSYKTKPIIAALDENPILQPEQLQLWSWISRYYMCSLGELMIAGMPNSLKLQSDTYYITSCNFEEEDLSTYKENEHTGSFTSQQSIEFS